MDEHENIEADFSEYYDKQLPAERETEIERHLAQCEACKSAYEEFTHTVEALSGLHQLPAPQELPSDIEGAIRQRSGGRFFGRKTVGDRIPFGLLALLALIVGLLILIFLRWGGTGALR